MSWLEPSLQIAKCKVQFANLHFALCNLHFAIAFLVLAAALTLRWSLADAAEPTDAKPAAVFEGKDTLLRPAGYREWVFVGSSLGLRYDKDAETKKPERPETYHNVYINPASYRAFAQTGKFPDGTVLMLELASAGVKKEPGLQGSYQKDFVALEAAVKDSKRFEEAWAYFSFDDKGGKLKEKATPFPKERCWSCHHEKAETDHVFTQFYPVLRAVAPKGTRE